MEPDDNISEKQWWFIHNKISIFLNRFEKTLVCQDCNNADTKAKSMIEGVCRYFSFTPKEISYFIVPEAHKDHKIDNKRLEEVFGNLKDIHEYRKTLCDVLLSRALLNNRIWSEPRSAPCIDHYKAARSILKNPERYDGSVVLNLKHKSDVGLRQLSIDLEKYEKKRHEKANRAKSDILDRKAKKKKRREIKREKAKKILDEGVYFNYGKPWEEDEVKELIIMHKKGIDIEDIALHHGRVPSAIKTRLKKLGYKPT